MNGDLPQAQRYDLGRVAAGVGAAWGLSAVIAGASSAYYNGWQPYRFFQDARTSSAAFGASGPPRWASDLQVFAAILFPLGLWWLVLACIEALGQRRNPSKYWHLGAVVSLIVLMVSDVVGRIALSPSAPMDRLATPRFIDDIALALIGLLALGVTAWFARARRRPSAAQRIDMAATAEN